MPKKLKRYYGQKHLHFLTWSCYQRKPLLGSVRGRDRFVKILDEIRQRYRFRLVGYVVMPEHVHLLISEPEFTHDNVMLLKHHGTYQQDDREHRSGGKQFKVEPGKKYRMPTLEGEPGGKIEFTDILLGNDGKAVKGVDKKLAKAKVVGEIVRDPMVRRGFFAEKVRLPDEPAGVMLVFRTFDRISYALIMEATSEIRVLDAVRSP